MSHHLPTDPAIRAGIYQSLDDVPERYRLHHHTAAFTGRDVWEEYLAEHGIGIDVSPSRESDVERFGNRWKTFMVARGRHHALCEPHDAEAYATELLDGNRTTRTAENYWANIERFYRWLHWDARFPHRYNPFLIAATEGEASRHLWDNQMRRAREEVP